MFPLAVKCSSNVFLLVPSSQWIKPKSEIFIRKEDFINTQILQLRNVERLTDPDVEMIIQQDVGRLEVEVEQWGLHGVEEIHAHGCLVNHLELLWPHQRVTGQKIVQ